jgi:hypothetical protein
MARVILRGAPSDYLMMPGSIGVVPARTADPALGLDVVLVANRHDPLGCDPAGSELAPGQRQYRVEGIRYLMVRTARHDQAPHDFHPSLDLRSPLDDAPGTTRQSLR